MVFEGFRVIPGASDPGCQIFISLCTCREGPGAPQSGGGSRVSSFRGWYLRSAMSNVVL